MPAPESTFVTEIGRYQVVRTLGQGAMGRVYLAHDPILDRDVAIKLLRGDLSISEDQRVALFGRMRHEARASARLSHPNIVSLYDMGEHPALGLFLVFEYVEGPSLKDKIQSGGVGPELAARLAREVGSALSTAHEAGVLHRDIKPENIIVSKNGAKVADFGIARVPDSTLTRDGGLLGTPAYSAPESIAEGVFSPQSDQFSLAATLYEAVSLHRAFPGDDAVTVATKIANDEPPPIATLCALDPRADTVLARALSKNPRARFASCDEFGRTLAEVLDASPRGRLATIPDGYHQQAFARRQRSLTLHAMLGGAVLGALIGIAASQLVGEVAPRSRAEPRTTPQLQRAASVGWLAPPASVEAPASPVPARPPPPKVRRPPPHPLNHQMPVPPSPVDAGHPPTSSSAPEAAAPPAAASTQQDSGALGATLPP